MEVKGEENPEEADEGTDEEAVSAASPRPSKLGGPLRLLARVRRWRTPRPYTHLR